mmetsp:Transcript_24374/g.64299  ORF Transcript_24374/g.64299 Transcript_24374/m.64299 type:complete len:344 (+) Transcript_24374:715-1746(+)
MRPGGAWRARARAVRGLRPGGPAARRQDGGRQRDRGRAQPRGREVRPSWAGAARQAGPGARGARAANRGRRRVGRRRAGAAVVPPGAGSKAQGRLRGGGRTPRRGLPGGAAAAAEAGGRVPLVRLRGRLGVPLLREVHGPDPAGVRCSGTRLRRPPLRRGEQQARGRATVPHGDRLRSRSRSDGVIGSKIWCASGQVPGPPHLPCCSRPSCVVGCSTRFRGAARLLLFFLPPSSRTGARRPCILRRVVYEQRALPCAARSCIRSGQSPGDHHASSWRRMAFPSRRADQSREPFLIPRQPTILVLQCAAPGRSRPFSWGNCSRRIRFRWRGGPKASPGGRNAGK